MLDDALLFLQSWCNEQHLSYEVNNRFISFYVDSVMGIGNHSCMLYSIDANTQHHLLLD